MIPILFKLEHLDRLREWLADYGVILPELEVKNSYSEFSDKKELNRYLKCSITEEHRQELYSFYSADLQLYERAI